MHTVEYLGDKMAEKMAEIGTVIKETICVQIQDSNREFRTKLTTDVTKSYADAAKKEKGANISDLKSIINEARHAEMSEERDWKNRASNIIIHMVLLKVLLMTRRQKKVFFYTDRGSCHR